MFPSRSGNGPMTWSRTAKAAKLPVVLFVLFGLGFHITGGVFADDRASERETELQCLLSWKNSRT